MPRKYASQFLYTVSENDLRSKRMSKIDQYVQAATRDNTRSSYQSAVRHFETEWSGFLPATADSVARYLVDHAEILAINTLKQRLAALAQWHIDQGFPDPTKAPVVSFTWYSSPASGAGKACKAFSVGTTRTGRCLVRYCHIPGSQQWRPRRTVAA
jgi:hypothetical protein